MPRGLHRVSDIRRVGFGGNYHSRARLQMYLSGAHSRQGKHRVRCLVEGDTRQITINLQHTAKILTIHFSVIIAAVGYITEALRSVASTDFDSL